MSASVALGLRSRYALAVIMTPLTQNPHCIACSSMNAFWMGCGFSVEPIPSSVVISAPDTLDTGVTQDRTACPLMMTVQLPHWPRPQPNFGPRNARSSLRMYKSGVAGSTSSITERPFTLRLIMAIAHLLQTPYHRAVQGCGFQPAASACFLKCVLVMNSCARYTGSLTIVVTTSQESPLASFVRS